MWIWKSDLISWEKQLIKQLPKETDSKDYWYLKGKLTAINRIGNKKTPV